MLGDARPCAMDGLEVEQLIPTVMKKRELMLEQVTDYIGVSEETELLLEGDRSQLLRMVTSMREKRSVPHVGQPHEDQNSFVPAVVQKRGKLLKTFTDYVCAVEETKQIMEEERGQLRRMATCIRDRALSKREGKKLEMEVHKQTKRSACKQQRQFNLEGQHVSETERSMVEKGEASHNRGGEKIILDLKQKLTDLQSDFESQETLVSNLVSKERAANDELQEARKAAVTVLKEYGTPSRMHVKLVGEIKRQPWEAAFRERYKDKKDADWKLKAATAISDCEVLLKDHNFRPLKTVEVRPNVFKYEVNEDDETLGCLRHEWGYDLSQTVIAALLELEEYNASGRFPIEVAWDSVNNREILMKDLIYYLKRKLDEKSEENRRAKRPRRPRSFVDHN